MADARIVREEHSPIPRDSQESADVLLWPLSDLSHPDETYRMHLMPARCPDSREPVPKISGCPDRPGNGLETRIGNWDAKLGFAAKEELQSRVRIVETPI